MLIVNYPANWLNSKSISLNGSVVNKLKIYPSYLRTTKSGNREVFNLRIEISKVNKITGESKTLYIPCINRNCLKRKNNEYTTKPKHTSKTVRGNEGKEEVKNKTTTKGVKGDQPEIRLLQEPSGA